MYTHIHSYAYIHTHVHTHTYIDNKYTHIHTCAHLHTYIPSSLLPHPSSLSSLTHLSLTSLYTVPCLLGDRKIAHSDMYEEVALSGRWTTLLKKLCSSHCFIVFVSLVDHWPLPQCMHITLYNQTLALFTAIFVVPHRMKVAMPFGCDFNTVTQGGKARGIQTWREEFNCGERVRSVGTMEHSESVSLLRLLPLWSRYMMSKARALMDSMCSPSW